MRKLYVITSMLAVAAVLFLLGPAQPTHGAALNESDVPEEADFCKIAFPHQAMVDAGVGVLVYGQIFESGMTDPQGPNPAISAEVGFGPFGSDPRVHGGWSYSGASFNVQVGFPPTTDEYVGTITVYSPDTYWYVYRFSLDGGTDYTYCDINGAGSNAGLDYEIYSNGNLTVTGTAVTPPPTATPSITPTPTATPTPCTADQDCDGVLDAADNCLLIANPAQTNSDRNFIDQTPPSTQDDRTWPNSDPTGDACDTDDDNDGILDVNEAAGCNTSGPLSPTNRDTDGDRVLLDTDGDQDALPLNANPAVNLIRDGCEAASLNGDRVVNSADQLLIALEITREVDQTLRLVSMDINKDGGVNSGDQLLMVGFIVVLGSCP